MAKELHLSCLDKPVTKVVHAVQGDTGRKLNIYIDDRTITSTMVYTFVAEKPSGLKIYNSATYVSGCVQVQLTSQTLAEVGNVKAQIQITDTDGITTSYMFYIQVDELYKDEASMESSNEYTALTAMQSDFANIKGQFDEVIAGVTVDSEVIGARVGADGTQYSTLSNRLNAENTAINADLTENIKTEEANIIGNKLLEMNAESGIKNKWDVTNIHSMGYHIKVRVYAGEKYIINGSGENANYPLWVTCNDTVVTGSASFTNKNFVKGLEIEIPSNSKYLYVNGALNYYPYAEKVIKGNIVWFGDSYVQANSLGSESNKRFSTLVSNALELKEFNYAVGGNGFFTDSVNVSNIFQQLVNASNGMTADEIRHTKMVVICGGRNDPNIKPDATYDDYKAIFSQLYGHLTNVFPNARYILVPFTFDATYVNATYFKYYNWIVSACKKYNIDIIPYAYTWLTGKFYVILSDNVHPNVEGHEIIARHIINSIKIGNDCNVQNVRLWGTSKTATWANIMIDAINGILAMYGTFPISSQLSQHDIMFEANCGANKDFSPYLGDTSNSLIATNLGNGISYGVYLKYDTSDATNNKIQILANTNIPNGNYAISYTKAYGHK